MENLYLFIVIVLFVLAISDLVVGVSNDAVNFLNSAIGSKVAPFKVIMAIAGLGVLFGATFSGGMMEVAREGIFHPNNFYFDEIMIIFLAVMLTDIILLDLFNTFGLPTSTTVSIVFELLGGAVGVAIIKMRNSAEGLYTMGDFINSDNALVIIFGILLSVVIAFTVGAIVQYFSRLIFSFNYTKPLKFLGSLWGGIAITAITYFILIKGSKGASFMTDDAAAWIKENAMYIIFGSLLFWTVILQILHWLFKINILKVIVLIGTFALAMAFAGNDLVNFIGVPLAGFESYKEYLANPGVSPDSLAMTALQQKVQTPTYMLLIAGLIMFITLWLSKKAKSVVKTELDLARQEEGSERFESSMLARTLVRGFLKVTSGVTTIIPLRVRTSVSRRFEKLPQGKKVDESPGASFDLIRASVNLFVASILIAFATSQKLPLSTTYVTFMVAMGTSLADGAWDRESAVYRISGVVTVIGGWFFTAFIAFTVAFLVATIISWGGIIAIFLLILLAISFVIRTHVIYARRQAKQEEEEALAARPISKVSIYETCTNNVIESIEDIQQVFHMALNALFKDKRGKAAKSQKAVKDFNKKITVLKKDILKIIKILEDDSVNTGIHYVEVADYLNEIKITLDSVVHPIYVHINNNYTPLNKEQIKTLNKESEKLDKLLNNAIVILKENNYKKIKALASEQENLAAETVELKKVQLMYIKKDGQSKRSSILYMEILNGMREISTKIIQLLEAQKAFSDFKRK